MDLHSTKEQSTTQTKAISVVFIILARIHPSWYPLFIYLLNVKKRHALLYFNFLLNMQPIQGAENYSFYMAYFNPQ